MTPQPLLSRSVPTLARNMAEGTVLARDLTEAALARHDPALNAYVAFTPDRARRQAAAADAAYGAGVRLGGLQGVPVSVKDLYGVAGLPTFAGTPTALPEVWTRDSALVQTLRRQPATTQGRWPSSGIVPLGPGFDAPGLLTRSADDAAFAFDQLDTDRVPDLDPDTALRIGVAEPFLWTGTDPGIAERVTEALRLIEASGARLTDQALPGCDEVYRIYHQGGIVSAELYGFLRASLPDWLATLDPRVRRRMEDGGALEAWEYLHRQARCAELGAQAAQVLAGFDAIISPTAPAPPVALLDDPDTYAWLDLAMLRNTCGVSFHGLCAVSMPAGYDAAGLPVGLQLIGAPRGEARLLAVARRIEGLLAKADVWHPPT